MVRIGTVAGVMAVLILGSGQSLSADLLGSRLGAWVVPGVTVFETARVGNTVYMAGNFATVAPRANSISRLAEFTMGGGTPARNLPVVGGGAVFALADDGAGGWFIGGTFTVIEDPTGAFVSRPRLAHIMANGTLDPAFAPNLSASVNSMTRVGSTLYVGGNFTSVSGQARGRGAAFDIGTGTLLPWNPAVGDGIVFAIASTASTVFVGGTFTTVGATARGGLAAVHPTTGALQAFVANLTRAATGGPAALNLLVSGNTLYVGGFFEAIGGTVRESIAALNATTAAVLPFLANTNASGGVRTLVLSGGLLYMGGVFTEVSGMARTGAAAVDAATGALGTWDPQVAGDVNALALSGSTMYLAGTFRSVRGELRANLGAVTTAGAGAVLPWNPGLSETTWAVAVTANTVVTGGVSVFYGAQSRRNLAAFDLATGDLLPLFADINGAVRGLTATPTTLYLSGFFTAVGGVARNWFAALDRHTGALLPWNPDATVGIGANSGGRVVLVDGARTIIGGFFGLVGGQPREGMAIVDAITGAVAAANAGMTGGAADFLLSGSTLYVSGAFTQLGGQPRNSLGAVDAGTLALLPFNANVTGAFVTRMRLVGSRLFFGGSLTQVGGAARANAAAVHATTGAVDPFAPSANGIVWDLEIRGERAILGGAFTTVNGVARVGLADVDIATGLTTGAFDAGATQGEVRSVRGNAEGVLVGGNSLSAGVFQQSIYFKEGISGPPGPPSVPSVRIYGSNLEVRWAAPPIGAGIEGYLLEAGTAPGLANIGTLPNGSSNPIFTFAGVPPGTFYIRVRAQNSAGVGPASPEVAFTAGVPGCTGVPQAPLFTPQVSGVNVTLNWPHAVSANGPAYQLAVGTGVGLSNIATLPVGSTTTFSAAGAPGAFFGRMQASSPCGVSAPSIDSLISIGGVAPPAPPTASWSVAGSTVTVNWTAVPGAAGYRLEAGTGPFRSDITVVPSAGTTLTAPGVPPGTYHVRVYAIGGAGQSLPSNELAIVVP